LLASRRSRVRVPSSAPQESPAQAGLLDDLTGPARELLLSLDFIDDEELARVAERRIIGYHERVATRPATDDERTMLHLGSFTPVLVFTRVTRTTTAPLGSLSLAARPDRFEVDYLIDA
jgi:hypothetical protein